MDKKLVYLIDLTHESKLGLGSDTMPLQLGFIAAYLKKEHGDRVDVQIFKFVDDFKKAAENNPPFILAASNYMWNIDLSYKFASLIKEKYPETIVIFGGPNYPCFFDEQVKWLKERPAVDFYVFKDGEIPFSRLVGFLLEKSVLETKKAKLPSCHSLVEGAPYFGGLDERLKDLDVIPSPYTTGLMDKFFEYRLIPTIQTNRGCPFTCAYCSEGEAYYSMIGKMSFERKKEEIDYILKKIKHTKSLRITDSNFGMYPEDVEFCEYLGKIQEKTGYPEYIGCSTGKNQKERILKCNDFLKGAIRLTASVQSLVPEVLKNIKRQNISLDDIMSLSDRVSDTETHSYSEIILALPGDSLKGEKESMEGLMRAGINNITQHQLAIIHGAELASKGIREKFGMKSMFRPIQRCVGLYSFLGKTFPSVEIEEICTSTNTLSFEDYLEARSLFLTVGLFYNDRIFAEVHGLLRLLGLSTWEWIDLIHKNIEKFSPEIKNLYDGFTKDTRNELWDSKEKLIKDVSADIDKYSSGELGGNLIYKYRSQAIAFHFKELHKIAFENLRDYLKNRRVDEGKIVSDIERFSLFQKSDIFNTDFSSEENYSYDIVKMIKDPSLARSGQKGSLGKIHYPVKIRIAHTDEQKDLIKRQLEFYGSDLGGLTMLISRFPVKRFYRTAGIIG